MLVRIYRNQQEIYRILLANGSTEAQAREDGEALEESAMDCS
jgi:hypothetical protein